MSALQKNVYVEPYVLFRDFSNILVLSRTCEQVALYEEKRAHMIAGMPEVHDTAKLLLYLRSTVICRILSAKAETPDKNKA